MKRSLAEMTRERDAALESARQSEQIIILLQRTYDEEVRTLKQQRDDMQGKLTQALEQIAELKFGMSVREGSLRSVSSASTSSELSFHGPSALQASESLDVQHNLQHGFRRRQSINRKKPPPLSLDPGMRSGSGEMMGTDGSKEREHGSSSHYADLAITVPENTPIVGKDRLHLAGSGKGLTIDSFGLVSTPRGKYSRQDSEASTVKPMKFQLIGLGNLGRGAGGTVKKALHVPTMRLCAVKTVDIWDDQHRDQLVSEINNLRENLVKYSSIHSNHCSGCGVRDRQQKGTKRRCTFCKKMFCGRCKKLFMSSLGSHSWRCLDNCDSAIIRDPRKATKMYFPSIMLPSSSSDAAKRESRRRRQQRGDDDDDDDDGEEEEEEQGEGGEEDGGMVDNDVIISTLLSRLSNPLQFIPMNSTMRHFCRQLLLSFIAQERGTLCPWIVDLFQVFYSDTKVSIILEYMDRGSLQDYIRHYGAFDTEMLCSSLARAFGPYSSCT